jgi:predicted glycogen debranching enzyme
MDSSMTPSAVAGRTAVRPSVSSAPMALYCLDTFGQLDPFVTREWQLTNGLGGYAASSIVGCNIRKYHGLLIAATLPPVGRMLTLSRLGELLLIDNESHELAVNRFRDNIHPHGERYLQKFELEDTARWTFDVAGVRVVKELLVCWLRNAVGIRYRVDTAGKEVEFRVAPFFAMRDFHSTRHAAGYDFPFESTDKSLAVKVDGLECHLRAESSAATTFTTEPSWWYGHVYPIETDRGQDDSEDLFTPGRFSAKVKGSATITFWAGLEPTHLDWDAELSRRQTAFAENAPSTTTRKLFRAANDFLVARKSPDGSDGTSVIAGYPWFADWGRDTFISLPGLMLATKKFDRAKQVLSVFAKYVSQGMIPNRFDDYTSEPSYNTVDASLWFIHACFGYLRASNDTRTFEKELRPACQQILDGYRRGTRFKILMDESDGLIAQGDEQTQLTWMDAKCNGIAFTPRQGKPVEINALWYHALKLMGEDKLAARVKDSFVKAFWISPFRGLADVVDGNAQEGYRRDNSIRPNQIFAASLEHSPLSREQQSAVVEVVRRELLTPVGLRTLSRSDAKYKGRYMGPQLERDAAYHNGAVWPWPIGAFLEAYLRVNDNSPDARQQASRWLAPLIDHLSCERVEEPAGGMLGSISEIFEADEPHRPVGCPAQAWSVAEVLRLGLRLGL